MAEGRWVAYYRVSTAEQGRSGLGLEAQKAAVESYLNGGRWKLLAEFTEVESGAHNDRPQLQAALKACRLKKATLLIAKLDRLSRDAHFLLGLEKAGVEFIACDMPAANKLTIGIMALVAQQEREMISARTKAALAAAKARGVVLGPKHRNCPPVDGRLGAAAQHTAALERAEGLRELLLGMKARGLSLRQVAAELTELDIATARGGKWSQSNLSLMLARLG